jgi:Lysyl oxidase
LCLLLQSAQSKRYGQDRAGARARRRAHRRLHRPALALGFLLFEFHPQHNHWHIGDVALFEVRKGSPTGDVVGGNSIKTTFCLIDWYKLEGNSPTSERIFWECQTSYQGIAPDWVDQYHHSLPGMDVDLTGEPNATDYYLVSTANYARTFVESNYTNNTAWVKFTLSGTGVNRKIEVTGNSRCATPGLCGVGAPNR